MVFCLFCVCLFSWHAVHWAGNRISGSGSGTSSELTAAGEENTDNREDPENNSSDENSMYEAEKGGIIGHRGWSADYTENTYEAFLYGARAGMPGLECDLNLTDGELICYHEEENRNTGCLFADYLDICAEYGCLGIVDLRTFRSACYREAFGLVEDKGLTDQIYFQCTSRHVLKAISRYSGGRARCWMLVRGNLTDQDILNASAIEGVTGINANAWTWDSSGERIPNEMNRSEEMIRMVQEAGMTYCVYSLDDAEDREQVIECGIDYIMSNDR